MESGQYNDADKPKIGKTILALSLCGEIEAQPPKPYKQG